MKKNDHKPPGSLEYRYQSLIIFLNRRCTVDCMSCNVNARPGNKTELSPQWLNSFFIKMEDLRFSGYILWTGGEPFLSYKALKIGIATALQKGYHSEILTSASWYNAHREWLEQLPVNENLSLRISLDSEHQKSVPFSRVIAFIHSAWERSIEVNFTLRETPGQAESINYYVEEIKKQLPEFFSQNHQRSRWIHYLPHIPISADGCASTSCLNWTHSSKYKQPCQMAFRDLVIGEDGLVYPCCGFFGFPFHKELAVGDPMKHSWESLAARQFSHPLFRLLKAKGPYGICQELKLKPEKWGWPPFQTPCHLCMALFKQMGQEVLKYFC